MFRLQNYIYNINTARRRGQQAQFLLPLVFFFLFLFFCGFAETEVTGLNLLGFCGALLRPEREGGRERKEDLITLQPATTKTNHLWIHCKH